MPMTLPFHDRAPQRSRTRKQFAKAPAIQAPTACEGCHRPAIGLTARGDQWLCALCSSILPAPSPHETAARLRKALDLADTIAANDGDAQAAALMTDADWDLAARAAGRAKPSIETRVEVVRILEQRARRKAAAHA